MRYIFTFIQSEESEAYTHIYAAYQCVCICTFTYICICTNARTRVLGHTLTHLHQKIHALTHTNTSEWINTCFWTQN